MLELSRADSSRRRARLATRRAVLRAVPALALPALAMPLLAGCADTLNRFEDKPPHGWATLPRDAVAGAGDPVRAAIFNTSYVFNAPASVAGRPADAARTVANYEFLAVEIPYGARWRSWNPQPGVQLKLGLPEVRQAFGIAPDAPSQAVVDAFYGAARAFEAGDQAAAQRLLSSPAVPGGAATLAALNAFPRLPTAAFATTLAQQELDAQDRMGSRPGGGPGGGGGGRM